MIFITGISYRFMMAIQLGVVVAATILVCFLRCCTSIRAHYLTQFVPRQYKAQTDALARSLDYAGWLVLAFIVKNSTVVGATKIIPVAADVWNSMNEYKNTNQSSMIGYNVSDVTIQMDSLSSLPQKQ